MAMNLARDTGKTGRLCLTFYSVGLQSIVHYCYVVNYLCRTVPLKETLTIGKKYVA